MRITLIGMSGAGKTHWSKKLVKKGFMHLCCDSLVEEKLDKELKPLGFSGIKDVARWMGQPYDKQYPETSEKYLSLEKEVMRELIKGLKANIFRKKNIVIDTTGSVIYTGKMIMDALSELTKVVYLDTCESAVKKMHELYLKDPKPVFWGKAFKKKNSEDDKDALASCYPNLLRYRTKKYKEYAHQTLEYFFLRQAGFTVSKFLSEVSG